MYRYNNNNNNNNNNNIRIHKFYNNQRATSKFWVPEGHMQQHPEPQFQSDL